MNAIETYDRNGLTVEIHYDESGCPNPRTDYDHAGTMYSELRNGWADKDAETGVEWPDYERINDQWVYAQPEQFCAAYIAWHRKHGSVIIPLCQYEYDRDNSLYESDDDDATGFLYMTAETVRREYSCKRITAAVRASALLLLESELREFQSWQQGDVYGYVISDDHDEHIDSCWGFIGELDYVQEAANEAADAIAAERARHAALVSATEMLAY